MTTRNEKGELICSICGGPAGRYGHNAQPLNSGRCCNVCNVLVTRERMKQAGCDIDVAELIALETAAENLKQRILERA